MQVVIEDSRLKPILNKVEAGARLSFEETARILTLAGFPPSGIGDPTVPTKPGSTLKLSQNLTAQRTLRELRLSATPK